MVESTESPETETAREVGTLSTLWWLWLPLAGTLALLVLPQVSRAGEEACRGRTGGA